MATAVDAEASVLTLSAFAEHIVEAIGVSTSDIQRDGLRVTTELGSSDGPMWLEVKTFCRNAEGKRYLDGNGEIATEVRRFPITSLTVKASL